MQPLDSLEIELPSYPLGHAYTAFFFYRREMDYSLKFTYFSQNLHILSQNLHVFSQICMFLVKIVEFIIEIFMIWNLPKVMKFL